MFLHETRTLTVDFLGDVNLYLALGLEVIMAIVLGGMIGHDREVKMKAAGVKTHILICLGSMLYTAVSILNTGPGVLADPNRMPAQVISGIGFLGAGAIIQSHKKISGLTTAATIWVVAAVGVTIGSGYPLSATIFTFTVLFVLKMIDPFYRLVSKNTDFHLEIVGHGEPTLILGPHMGSVPCDVMEKEIFIDNSGNKFVAHYRISIHNKDMMRLAGKLGELESIDRVSYHGIKKAS